jgi:phage terminase large subunit
VTVQFPAKTIPLFRPHRIKDIRGGRDAAKSWSVAAALIEIASAEESQLKAWGLWMPDGKPERIVCCRESMNSIADSVYQLLEDTLDRLQLRSMWRVEKQGWVNHRTGAEFIFRGLRNPDALKSLEGASRAWIEEAQSMSAASWRKIPPTVRRKNSELWFTWNPELDTDPTYKELVLNPDPDTVHVILNYTDNPWRSEVLDAKREKMRAEDPEEFQHIYMGQPRRAIVGAIYASEIRLAESQGRIGDFPYNPALPVDTGWDLGDSDLCCIWFFQRSMGQYRAIDYIEDNHKPLSHYLSEIEAKGYTRGKAYFPWDASSKMLVGSLEETMRQRGQTVVVMPRQPRAAGIDAAREMLGTCWFNLATTDDGINRLRYYRQAPTKIIDPVTGDTVMSMQPVHDQNSHGADAFRTIAMGYRRPVKPEKLKPVATALRRYVPPPTAWS